MLFNSQNAREFAARSAEGRRQAKLLRLQRDQMLDRLIQEANDRTVQPAAQAPKEDECPDDDFVSRKLERVRLQWNSLDEMLADQLSKSPLDAGAVDRLAAAICRVAELERTLANRPLPGSRRPSPERRPTGCTFTPPTEG